MRWLFAGLIFFHASGLAAQTVLFKVITFAPGVRIDQRPAELGMDVTTSHHSVVIPKAGYLGVVTNRGHAFTLTHSVLVQEVPVLAEELYLRARAAVVQPDPKPEDWLQFPLAGTESFDFIGDTLFMYWTEGSANGIRSSVASKADYEFRFLNGDEEELVTRHVSANWVLFALPKEELMDASGTGEFLMEVRSEWPKQQSDLYSLRFAEKRRIMAALAQLDEIPRNYDRYFYQLAMLYLMDLRFDMHLPLYHILTEKRTTSDPVLSSFWKVLCNDYHFDAIVIKD